MTAPSWVQSVPQPSRLYRYFHSRLRRLDVERQTVDRVLAEFGLKSARRPRNLPMGWRNHCVVVDTNAGRKVLKQYRPQWKIGAVLCEHSILRRLAELDIASTRVVSTPSGETVVLGPEGIFTLFDFIEGSTYSLSVISDSRRLELIGIAGRALSRMHRELRGFVPEGNHHLGFRSYEGLRQRTATWYDERVSRLVERTRRLPAGQAELAAPLLRASTRLTEEIDSLENLLGRANLPRTVIHGDYGFHNLIFHDEREVTILDFELARIEWRIYDIVMVLSRSWRSGMWKDFATRMRVFVSAYENIYPLEPVEREMFEQIWALQSLQLAVKNWNAYFETGRRKEKLARAANALTVARHGPRVAEQAFERHCGRQAS